MSNESWIEEELNEMERRHLLRHAPVYPSAGGRLDINGIAVLNFASNDYLNLASHPDVIASAVEALETYGAGATSSRLVAGTLPLHEELEYEIARHKGYPSALVFGSGYMTNAGVIPALVGRSDQIFADRLAHASLLDAALLSRAKLERFHHNDAGHLEELLTQASPSGRKLVVTESIFSMDGDRAPLGEIADSAERHGALLMVDEAHATGIFGPAGAGLIQEKELTSRVNVCMGTLSKALGGYGGFVACSGNLRRWLINRARAFIYTTAPPPSAVGAALAALKILEREPHLGRELLSRADRFRTQLKEAGFNTLNSSSQIIPVLVGENAAALRLAARLREQGILAAAIRPPTVPPGTARLRLSVTLAHTEEDLAHTAAALKATALQEGIL